MAFGKIDLNPNYFNYANVYFYPKYHYIASGLAVGNAFVKEKEDLFDQWFNRVNQNNQNVRQLILVERS